MADASRLTAHQRARAELWHELVSVAAGRAAPVVAADRMIEWLRGRRELVVQALWPDLVEPSAWQPELFPWAAAVHERLTALRLDMQPPPTKVIVSPATNRLLGVLEVGSVWGLPYDPPPLSEDPELIVGDVAWLDTGTNALIAVDLELDPVEAARSVLFEHARTSGTQEPE